ncbi:MAG: PD40 domain-containing protein [Candidatus Sericytochromatia bacterium]|nr:PD40 domain-containing protein [Candidatus Sericytochromatia bacterium]
MKLLYLGLVLLSACPAEQPEGWVLASPRSGNWEIYQTPAEAGEWQNLTRYPASERYPDLSPDGRQIVFASDRNGSFDLYLMDRAGDNLRELTRSPFPDTTPRWSPDGRTIVFVSERNDRAENLYLVALDSKDVTRLSQAEHTHYDPDWFPDGQRLVCVGWKDGQSELYRLDLKTRQPVALTRDGRPKRQPAVSPDGKALLYAVMAAPDRWQLEQLTLDSGKVQILARDFVWLGFPRWRGPDEVVFSAISTDAGDPAGAQAALWHLALPAQMPQQLLPQVREAVRRD